MLRGHPALWVHCSRPKLAALKLTRIEASRVHPYSSRHFSVSHHTSTNVSHPWMDARARELSQPTLDFFSPSLSLLFCYIQMVENQEVYAEHEWRKWPHGDVHAVLRRGNPRPRPRPRRPSDPGQTSTRCPHHEWSRRAGRRKQLRPFVVSRELLVLYQPFSLSLVGEERAAQGFYLRVATFLSLFQGGSSCTPRLKPCRRKRLFEKVQNFGTPSCKVG